MATDTPPTAVAAAPTLSPERLAALVDGAVGSDDEPIDVTAPATTERIGRIPAATADDVVRAVETARESSAGSAWADRPARERAAVLDRFADRVTENRAELLDLLQLETGKSRRTAAEEILEVPMRVSTSSGTDRQ